MLINMLKVTLTDISLGLNSGVFFQIDIKDYFEFQHYNSDTNIH